MLVMDLEKTEARNDCAGEGQQEFNPPIESKMVLSQKKTK
jgi:hypothetical protein